jgi:radical SAM superfamily enzyme YgiQ (UPF0313 family)
MKSKFLLINPWIYDFSAVNLWSRPLGLLHVAEYLSQYDIDIHLIDCTDMYKTNRRYGTGKFPREIIEKPDILQTVPRNFARYGMSTDTFIDLLTTYGPFDMVCVTSVMTYWYPGVLKAIEMVRDLYPHVPVILGGIYATLYDRHAADHSGADHVYTGPINSAMVKIMRNFGIELIKKNKPISYYTMGLYRSYPFAPLMTSKGCPYHCSYCASSSLFQGFVQRSPSEVIDEITELYRMGVRDFAFYDDALFVNADAHIKVILQAVLNSDMNVRFHCPNGVHARFIDNDLAGLLKRSGFTTLRISLETVDTGRQVQTGGKITSVTFQKSIQILKAAGFSKEHIGVYLMYGLPGQGLGEVKEGIQFLMQLNVGINLTEFSPIPHTQCWNELIEQGIIDENIDPLLTNNSVFSALYGGYDWMELDALKNSVKQYNSS